MSMSLHPTPTTNWKVECECEDPEIVVTMYADELGEALLFPLGLQHAVWRVGVWAWQKANKTRTMVEEYRDGTDRQREKAGRPQA